MDLHARRFAYPRGLPGETAITPKTNHSAANLLLETRAAVPMPILLVSDHSAQIPRQVHHHRVAPFADRHIENSARVGGVNLALRKVPRDQVFVSGGT